MLFAETKILCAGEHARPTGRPPSCGPRRPPKKLIRTAMTKRIQRVLSTKHCSRSVTPVTCASPSPVTELLPAASRCATASVHGNQPVHTLNSRHGPPRSSARLSTAAERMRESRQSNSGSGDGSASCDNVPPTSVATPRHNAPTLDNVDMWEDNSSDCELKVLTAAETAGGPRAAETLQADLTTEYRDKHRVTKRFRDRHRWSRKNNEHTAAASSCRLPQQTDTSDADNTWTAAACVGQGGVMPVIVESCGRPATANISAAELSRGSVELRQRRTAAGLQLFVRGMKFALIGNRERSTRSEVRPNEAKVTRLNYVGSPQQRQHSTVDILHLSSKLSCSTLRFH